MSDKGKDQIGAAREAVKHLTNDNNDGHKLYAISECLLSIAESLHAMRPVYGYNCGTGEMKVLKCTCINKPKETT